MWTEWKRVKIFILFFSCTLWSDLSYDNKRHKSWLNWSFIGEHFNAICVYDIILMIYTHVATKWGRRNTNKKCIHIIPQWGDFFQDGAVAIFFCIFNPAKCLHFVWQASILSIQISDIACRSFVSASFDFKRKMVLLGRYECMQSSKTFTSGFQRHDVIDFCNILAKSI